MAVVAPVLCTDAALAISSTGKCGGNGSNTTTLTCPAGQYVVGISVRGATYVDQIGVRCAKFDSTGTRIGTGSWKSGGPGGGSVTRDRSCTVAGAVNILDLRSGIYLDKVAGGFCLKRKSVAPGAFEETQVDAALTLDIGGGGGKSCRLKCPGGEALYSVTITHGAWIDSIKGACRP